MRMKENLEKVWYECRVDVDDCEPHLNIQRGRKKDGGISDVNKDL